MMIVRPKNFREMEPFFYGLSKIYKECFSGSPWYFALSEREALMTLKDAFELPGCIFSIASGLKIKGAAIASPLKHHPEVSSIVKREKGDIVDETIYCQAIFVDPLCQGKAVGTSLHMDRLQVAKEAGFKYAVQRTSPDSLMYSIIQKTGFEPIGECEVLCRRDYGDGKIVMKYDTRVVSIKTL